jgi:transposase InsO family protein
MRAARPAGACHRREHRRAGQLPAPHQDLVQRRFVADAPARPWCTDLTEHPTADGKVYCAAVLEVFTRQIVGWSIADPMSAELVVDALDMARWPTVRTGAIVHSDRGSQYTSPIFGHRLRTAVLLGSMGRVTSSVDNTMMESFWSTLQRELLDPHLDQPRRTRLGDLRMDRGVLPPAPPALRPRLPDAYRLRSPPHRRRHRGMITTPTVSGKPGQAPLTVAASMDSRRIWWLLVSLSWPSPFART